MKYCFKILRRQNINLHSLQGLIMSGCNSCVCVGEKEACELDSRAVFFVFEKSTKSQWSNRETLYSKSVKVFATIFLSRNSTKQSKSGTSRQPFSTMLMKPKQL